MEEDQDPDIQEVPIAAPTPTDNQQKSDSISSENVRERCSSMSPSKMETATEKHKDNKRRSDIWAHYDEVALNGMSYAKCKYCKNT
jgi:hypothetical protein